MVVETFFLPSERAYATRKRIHVTWNSTALRSDDSFRKRSETLFSILAYKCHFSPEIRNTFRFRTYFLLRRTFHKQDQYSDNKAVINISLYVRTMCEFARICTSKHPAITIFVDQLLSLLLHRFTISDKRLNKRAILYKYICILLFLVIIASW